ncbi:MAG: LexA family transcriptional regulator [bacterium]
MDRIPLIKALVSHYGEGKSSRFAEKLSVKPQTISTWIARNTWDIDLIFANCDNISAEWLLTGEGEMLKKERKKDKEPTISASIAPAKEVNENTIPLVSQSAVAGFGNADFCITDQDVKEYYVVPKFKYCKVDFMIEITGSSMYPKYNSGDVVACTIIRDSNFIQWNRCHIIATQEQGILCKRLMRSDKDGCLSVISDNPSYPPYDVPVAEITGIALICGVIRAE